MEFKLWDQAPQTIAKFSILKPILAIHHLLLLTEHFSSWSHHPHKLLTRSTSFKGKTLNTYHAVLNKELLERKLCNTVVEVKFKCCGFVLFVTSSAFCLWRSWHQRRCLQEKQQEASLGRQLNSLLERNGKALVSAFYTLVKRCFCSATPGWSTPCQQQQYVQCQHSAPDCSSTILEA